MLVEVTVPGESQVCGRSSPLMSALRVAATLCCIITVFSSWSPRDLRS